jgi:alkylhydroperoxidase/carboxymuconolactone decarboxylase family protein YurZ
MRPGSPVIARLEPTQTRADGAVTRRTGAVMAIGEAPVLEALTDINAVSIARTDLDPATLILVRVAALVAVDAPAASYLMHIGPAIESGLKLEDIQDVLVAVAPITGAPRVLAAARRITDALGIAIAIVEADAAGTDDE